MASVRRLPSGRWQLIVYTGRDQLTQRKTWARKTVDADNKRHAQLQANEWELELLGGETTGERGTVAELLTDWLRMGEATWSPSTLKEHRRIADAYLRRPLGHVDVDKITTRTLDRLYMELTARGGRCTRRPCTRPPCTEPGHSRRCQRRACIDSWRCPTHNGACATLTPCEESPCEHGAPLTTATVHRIHVVARAALQQAVVWGWVRRNPAEHANPGRVVTEEVQPPEGEDVILLLAEAEQADPRLATYLALAIESGARRGAMHALRWTYWSGPQPSGTSHIRFPKVISDGQEIPATGGKRGGRATLGPHVTAALVAHHDAMFARAMSAGTTLPGDAFMFSDDPTGRVPWRPDSTSRKVRLLGRTGLEARLKDLRHLMATQLLATPGISPRVVADRGGWSQLHTMLGVYAHSLPASDAAAAGVVDRLLGQQ